MDKLRIVKGIGIGIAVTALLLSGAYGVFAATAQNASQYPPIVDRIAKAFNLDPAKVDKVFLEERDARQAERNTAVESRLDQLVKDKTITEAQKTAIMKKREEIQNKMESLRGLTPEKRLAEMQKLRAELDKWQQDNGLESLNGIIGLGKRGGFGRGYGRGMMGAGSCGQAFNCGECTTDATGYGRGMGNGNGAGYGNRIGSGGAVSQGVGL